MSDYSDAVSPPSPTHNSAYGTAIYSDPMILTDLAGFGLPPVWLAVVITTLPIGWATIG